MLSFWDERIKLLNRLIMKPLLYNDLLITLLDALPALHGTDWTIGTHRHPWFEFNYVSEGALYTVVDNYEFLVSDGSCFLIPPGVFHSHRHCNHMGDDGFCLRWQLEVVTFSKEYTRLYTSAKNIFEVLSVPRKYATAKDADKFFEGIDDKMGLEALQAIFLQWIIQLFEQWKVKNEENHYYEDRDNILVKQALLYLTEYYSQPVEVKNIADSINISYRHLARIFKSVTGFTIVEKLNDIRVNRAKSLLKDTNNTIHDIAAKVGFDNEFYFSNVFSRYTRTTPSDFRKKFYK